MRVFAALLLVLTLAGCASWQPVAGAPAGRLPLVTHPAAAAGSALVVFYTGDAGARSGERTLAGLIADAGAPVVTVDSLAYFTGRHRLEDAAGDLAALIDHYGAAWDRPQVVLVGYSFGGSALPRIVARLPAAERARVRSLMLVAPRDYVEWRLWPHSWINIRPPHAQPLEPDLRALTPLRIVCIYGLKDGLAACPRLPAGLAEVHAVAGGHTFGRDYAPVAALIAAEASAPSR